MSILYGPLLGAHGPSLCYGGGLWAPFSLAAEMYGVGASRISGFCRGRRDLRHAPVY